MPLNPVRGEARALVGDVDLTIVITMGKLAELSDALKCQSLQDLYARLFGTEPMAVTAAIRLLTIAGTRNGERLKARTAADAALAVLSISDMNALQAAFVTAMAALIREPVAEAPAGNP